MQSKSLQGFSAFSWMLALFCLPSALWPLSLFISAKLTENLNLTSAQINFFSILCWIYPAILLLISGLLYKLHRTHSKFANFLLALSFIGFYSLLTYFVKSI
ncbi:hypothetical protein A6B43_03540 [Vespertiliibacter pulmonis]|uniref:Uncharacterized protein n=1 Tax=Vespertiliibacter pulmonis TaxID=1443036 RepID=A0A3N4VIC7_9PAST|nr:DUF5389 family protein [Vespertiliibacter pulmonis]QLB20666.1 hypothetical protein A6B43_03540 [Vespertiliibacter pulmonis]RPE82802.1 hypothetical protein EDC46_1478 [Vespertiliibacter pulmonis]